MAVQAFRFFTNNERGATVRPARGLITRRVVLALASLPPLNDPLSDKLILQPTHISIAQSCSIQGCAGFPFLQEMESGLMEKDAIVRPRGP